MDPTPDRRPSPHDPQGTARQTQDEDPGAPERVNPFDTLGTTAVRVYRGVRSGGQPRTSPVSHVQAHLRTDRRSIGLDMVVICAALLIFGALLARPLDGNLLSMQSDAEMRYLMDKNNR